MARDVEKNIPIYLIDNGLFTGEIGSSGDSEDYTLPAGMTIIEPPTIPEGQQAIFDFDLQTWSLEWINPYDGLTQAEKDAWNAAIAKQRAIDEAQDTVDKNLAKAVDGIAMLLQKYIPNLTAGESEAIQSFRDKYTAWIELQDN